MQLQHEFDMAGLTACDVKSLPTRRYRAYIEMLGNVKKERKEYAEQN